MALTAQEEAGLRTIFNSFVAAGYTTQAQVQAALTRLKLEQELRALESAETNLRATYTADTETCNSDLSALQASQAAKQAEIDALP